MFAKFKASGAIFDRKKLEQPEFKPLNSKKIRQSELSFSAFNTAMKRSVEEHSIG
jgi:hypothetical protein